jgi:hypothetical protein
VNVVSLICFSLVHLRCGPRRAREAFWLVNGDDLVERRIGADREAYPVKRKRMAERCGRGARIHADLRTDLKEADVGLGFENRGSVFRIESDGRRLTLCDWSRNIHPN